MLSAQTRPRSLVAQSWPVVCLGKKLQIARFGEELVLRSHEQERVRSRVGVRFGRFVPTRGRPPVERQLIRIDRSRLEIPDQHEAVVMARNIKRLCSMPQHLDHTRSIGFHPDRGRRSADVPQKRAEDKPRATRALSRAAQMRRGGGSRISLGAHHLTLASHNAGGREFEPRRFVGCLSTAERSTPH